MPDLKELGLVSLTSIRRGSVRIEKNPNLCYADNTNWDIVTEAANGGNSIMVKNQLNN